MPGLATSANAGDATDNDFIITWRCGTIEGDMNGTYRFNRAIDYA